MGDFRRSQPMHGRGGGGPYGSGSRPSQPGHIGGTMYEGKGVCLWRGSMEVDKLYQQIEAAEKESKRGGFISVRCNASKFGNNAFLSFHGVGDFNTDERGDDRQERSSRDRDYDNRQRHDDRHRGRTNGGDDQDYDEEAEEEYDEEQDEPVDEEEERPSRGRKQAPKPPPKVERPRATKAATTSPPKGTSAGKKAPAAAAKPAPKGKQKKVTWDE